MSDVYCSRDSFVVETRITNLLLGIFLPKKGSSRYHGFLILNASYIFYCPRCITESCLVTLVTSELLRDMRQSPAFGGNITKVWRAESFDWISIELGCTVLVCFFEKSYVGFGFAVRPCSAVCDLFTYKFSVCFFSNEILLFHKTKEGRNRKFALHILCIVLQLPISLLLYI